MAQDTDTSGSMDRLQVKCEPGFKQKVRVEAAKAGKSMSQFVRDTLQSRWADPATRDKCFDVNSYDDEPSGDYEGAKNSQGEDNSAAKTTPSSCDESGDSDTKTDVHEGDESGET